MGESIAALQLLQRPKLIIIIEAWRSDAPLWGNGPASKPTLLLQSQHHFCSVEEAINQNRLLAVRVNHQENLHWQWDSSHCRRLPRMDPPCPNQDHLLLSLSAWGDGSVGSTEAIRPTGATRRPCRVGKAGHRFALQRLKEKEMERRCYLWVVSCGGNI